MDNYLVTAILACCALESLQGADSASPRQQKKHYVTKSMLRVTKKGITVRTNKGPVKVKTLRTDEKGVFVYRSDLRIKGEYDGDHPCCGCDGNHTTDLARDACEAAHDAQDSGR